MAEQYKFQDGLAVGELGIYWLERILQGSPFENHEQHPYFQRIGVDMLLEHVGLEVKTDRYATGNFFFETLSNEGAGTMGCFLSSRSDWLVYFFTATGEMFFLPMREARAWFTVKKDQLRLVKVNNAGTPLRPSYVTTGRLAPIVEVMKACSSAFVVNLDQIPDMQYNATRAPLYPQGALSQPFSASMLIKPIPVRAMVA